MPKKKQSKRNPSDPILLARSVFEAAVGEPLMPKPKHSKGRQTKRKKK